MHPEHLHGNIMHLKVTIQSTDKYINGMYDHHSLFYVINRTFYRQNNYLRNKLAEQSIMKYADGVIAGTGATSSYYNYNMQLKLKCN